MTDRTANQIRTNLIGGAPLHVRFLARVVNTLALWHNRARQRRILASPGGRALRNMRISRGDAWQEYSQTLRAGVADMPVYIVAKNDVPCHATFNEQEARQLYDSMLQSGRYRRVSAAVLFAYWEPHRWPQSMAQSTPW